jgi:hypothetical protein
MAVNPEVEGVVSARPNPDADQADWSVRAPAESLVVPRQDIGYIETAPVAERGFGDSAAPIMSAPETEAQVAPEATRDNARSRGWVGVVAVGCVGLIAAGTLGYFLYSTTNQRDAALRQVATTKATLSSTEDTLTVAQQDLIARKTIAAYTRTYVADSGRVHIEYQKLEACTKFGACRTAAQSLLTNLQAFQSDRSAAGVPAAMANSNAMLRDALSAAIAADQEFISGMDTGNLNKIKDGWRKLSAAMLSVAKAEAALGAELQ